ncbi:MAG: hypothetical protein QW597_01890 [Thermoplasmataceae archaeon]
MTRPVRVTYRKSNPNSNARDQVEELEENLRLLKLALRGNKDRLAQTNLEKYGGISRREAKVQIKVVKKAIRRLTGNTWEAYFKVQNRMFMHRIGPYFSGIIGYNDKSDEESENIE